MPYYSSKLAKTTSPASDPKAYHQRKRDLDKDLSGGKSSRPWKPGGYSNHGGDAPKRTSFSNIQTHQDDDESGDSGDDTWKNNTLTETSDTQAQLQLCDNEDSLSEASNEDQEEQDPDEAMLDNMLAAFADHRQEKTDRKDHPCLRKIFSGTCNAEGCPYGHRLETLMVGAKDMIGKLNTFVKTQDTGAPYKVLSKQKYVKN
jgi:hypothetical protein